MGRPSAHPRNRQDRPPGRRRRARDLRRNRRARDRRFDEGAEAGLRLLSADRQLPGKDLCRRQDPGRLFQARRPSERKGNAGFPPHRPPDPSALRRWLQERHAGRRHRHAARSRERSGHRRNRRHLGGADAVGHSLHGSGRRRPRRFHQRPVRAQSACRRDAGIQARPHRRRHRRCRADGRIRSQGTRRSHHARRGHVRPQGLPAGHRRDHQARRGSRQGPARLHAAEL